MAKLKAAGYIPFALGNEDRWPAGIFAHYLMDRYAGPELIQKLVTGEDRSSFQNSGYLEAFRHLNRWVKAGYFSEDSNDTSTEGAVRLFTEGRAAMYLNGNWDINLFSGDNAPDDFQSRVGVIPFPSREAAQSRLSPEGIRLASGCLRASPERSGQRPWN